MSLNQTNCTDPDTLPKLFARGIVFLCLDVIGITTCVVNISVFASRSVLKKHKAFQYLLVMSINDLIYITPISLLPRLVCQLETSPVSWCSLTTQQAIMMIDILFSDWLTSFFAFFNILIEIYLSLERLFTLLKKKLIITSFWYVIAIMGTFSLLYYLPTCFMKQATKLNICPSSNESLPVTVYSIQDTEFGLSTAGNVIMVVLSIIRLLCASVLLLVLNLLTIWKFIQFESQKKKLEGAGRSRVNHHRGSLSIMYMLILVSILYAIGTTPYMIYLCLYQLNYPLNEVYPFVARMFLYSLIILKFLLHLVFNRWYRQRIKLYARPFSCYCLRNESKA